MKDLLPIHDSCAAQLASLTQEVKHTSQMLIQRDIALMQANTHLEDLDHAKSEFVSIAAHQLRTPLTSIKWFSEVLMANIGTQIDDKSKKNLANIMQAGEHMSDLINALLSVSRLELGTLETQIEEVDLNVLVEKITTSLEVIRAKNKINSITNIAEEHVTIQSDRQFIELILHNLISNAYKYTPIRGTVTVDVSRNETNGLIIQIVDTGYGIPKAEQKKVFGKFYRASNIRDGADGTGLGLHIVQMATEQLGGTLTMQSIENEGTTFTVTLPADSKDPEANNIQQR